MCRAGTASAVVLSAGFFRELLLHDDLAKPGHVIEEHSRPWRSGSPEASATSPGSARPATAGSFSPGRGVRRWLARRSVPAARPWLIAGMLPRCRGPARRASWPQPRARHRAFVRAGRFPRPGAGPATRAWPYCAAGSRAQNAARLCRSMRRLLIAARVATWGIPGHLSASRRPSGQAGPTGSPASFTGSRRWIEVICIGSSFAVCGCYGHCVRCTTRRAVGRLTAEAQSATRR